MKKIICYSMILVGITVLVSACYKGKVDTAGNEASNILRTVEPITENSNTPEKKLEAIVPFLQRENIDATRLAYTININETTLDLTFDLKNIYEEIEKTSDLNSLVNKKPMDTFRLFYKAIQDKNAQIAKLLIIENGIDVNLFEKNITDGQYKLKELDSFNNRIVQIKDRNGKEYLVFQNIGKYELALQDSVWKVCPNLSQNTN